MSSPVATAESSGSSSRSPRGLTRLWASSATKGRPIRSQRKAPHHGGDLSTLRNVEDEASFSSSPIKASFCFCRHGLFSRCRRLNSAFPRGAQVQNFMGWKRWRRVCDIGRKRRAFAAQQAPSSSEKTTKPPRGAPPTVAHMRRAPTKPPDNQPLCCVLTAAHRDSQALRRVFLLVPSPIQPPSIVSQSSPSPSQQLCVESGDCFSEQHSNHHQRVLQSSQV